MKQILLILLTCFSLTSVGQPLMGIISSSENNISTQSTLLTGLVAYWKMDEASGNAIDKIASYSLTPISSPTQGASGKIGTSVTYTRASYNYLDAPTATKNAVFKPLTSSFSVTAWVKVTGSAGTIRAITGLTGGTYYYIAAGTADKWMISNTISGSAVSTLSNSTLTLGQWYHIAVVFNRAGYVNMWVDGVKQTAQQDISSYTAASVGAAITSARIGNWNSLTYEFDGSIDEMKVWHRVITQLEITEDYNNGVAGTPLIP